MAESPAECCAFIAFQCQKTANRVSVSAIYFLTEKRFFRVYRVAGPLYNSACVKSPELNLRIFFRGKDTEFQFCLKQRISLSEPKTGPPRQGSLEKVAFSGCRRATTSREIGMSARILVIWCLICHLNRKPRRLTRRSRATSPQSCAFFTVFAG